MRRLAVLVVVLAGCGGGGQDGGVDPASERGEGWTAYAPEGGCEAQPVVDRRLVERLGFLRRASIPRRPPPAGLRTDVARAGIDPASAQVAARDALGRRLYVYLVVPEAGRDCKVTVGLACVRLARREAFGAERCVAANRLDEPGWARDGRLAFGIAPDGVERVKLIPRSGVGGIYVVERNVWWGRAPAPGQGEPRLVAVD